MLDGVVNPQRVWYSANFDQDRAFDRNMNVFWRYLASHPRAFHLGKQLAGDQARLLPPAAPARPQARRRAAGSVPTSSPTRCSTPPTTSTTGSSSGYAYSDLVRKRRGGSPRPTLYRDGNMGDDNGFAIYNAVQCTDVPWPGWAAHPPRRAGRCTAARRS